MWGRGQGGGGAPAPPPKKNSRGRGAERGLCAHARTHALFASISPMPGTYPYHYFEAAWDAGYLASRGPLPIHVNPAMGIVTEGLPNSQVCRIRMAFVCDAVPEPMPQLSGSGSEVVALVVA